MKPLKQYGGKRCVICRKVFAPNKIDSAVVNGVPGLWVCKDCEKKGVPRRHVIAWLGVEGHLPSPLGRRLYWADVREMGK